ncbi:MAG: DsbA family protein [Tropicimonas sp.]|uniref:DsbA family protein n=1 Tax=Tropicimonas sp. TaxID=2067044 RepID=UPI003A8C876A
MKRYLSITALIAATAGGTGFWMSQQTAPAPLPALVGAAQAAAETESAGEIVEMTLGNPDAKVHVIEYASFTCSHCANFEKTVFPEIRKNYIDGGKISFTFRDVYFDRYGLWAGMVARCDPMRYFGVQDLVFEDIAAWASGEPAQVADGLRKIGRKAGLSDEQVNACLQDAGKAESLVAWWEANAREHDINSTPSFIINGEKYPNMSYADFAKVLDEKLAE